MSLLLARSSLPLSLSPHSLNLILPSLLPPPTSSSPLHNLFRDLDFLQASSSSPSMNVTKSNFQVAAEELEQLLPTCEFYAIDEEMTGISMKSQVRLI